MRVHLVAIAAISAGASACLQAPRSTPQETLRRLEPPAIAAQRSGTTALLQAVSAVSEQVVWVSGHAGTFARSLDGGETWRAGRVPGADTLQFRDVHAVSADTAYLLAAGTGELSRLYKTTDGGHSWTLQHQNREPEAFFDCFSFWDGRRGVAFGDAVRGQLFLLITADGGATWRRVAPERLPAALPGEGSFAASGTCVATVNGRRAWVGMGNAAPARVLRTDDAGSSWAVAEAPVVAGEGSGLASIIFRDSIHGVALGGEVGRPAARGDYVAVTGDGGRSWVPGGRPTFAGAVYGAAYVPGAPTPTIVAVGPNGADISVDDGKGWTRLDSLAYWSVGFASPRAGWAVGPRGRIVKIRLFE